MLFWRPRRHGWAGAVRQGPPGGGGKNTVWPRRKAKPHNGQALPVSVSSSRPAKARDMGAFKSRFASETRQLLVLPNWVPQHVTVGVGRYELLT
jgi:hypothetical protein